MQAKQKRWFWSLVTVLALVASPAWAWEKQASSSERVAMVNGSVITQQDFNREMSRVQGQFLSMGQHLDDSQLKTIKKDILEKLIDLELLYQEGQKNGVKVDEATVNEQLGTMKGRFPSEDEFKIMLNKMNITEEEIKSQIKKEMTIQLFIDKQFGEKVKVPEQEIKEYYDSNLNLFKKPAQVRASHILIKVEPGANEKQKAAARKELDQIKQKLQKGGDFAALAKEFSQGPSGVNGGDLGYFRKEQMVKPFAKAAFALKPGEVSDIVETQFGYHLIKVMDKKPESILAYQDVKNNLGKYLKLEKIQSEVGSYVGKLKEKATVERFFSEALK